LKALILAAGTATRLRPLTNSTPKCMLEVGGISIIERTINNLIACGINDFIIVTGFYADKLKDFLTEKYPGLNILYIHNPVYDSTNNIYSLWLAHNAVENSKILLLDSDIIFDKRIAELLVNSELENCLALRSSDEIGIEEMKVTTDTNSMVLEIAKTILPENAAGESVGIEKFSKNFVNKLFQILEILIEDQKQVDKFYELAFQIAISDGQELYACDVRDLKCIEIDTPDDMEAANVLVQDLK
jgi:choline kinase